MAMQETEPFEFKDCSLIAISTGFYSQNLAELRDRISQIDIASIYHHFWGTRMRPRFDDPDYNNDFASWAWYALGDKILAERLSVIAPSGSEDFEEIRELLIEVIDERIDEIEIPPTASRENRFYFIKSQMVVFETLYTAENLSELVANLKKVSTGSVFYHFIDGRRRMEVILDDFSTWLKVRYGTEMQGLINELASVDPYFRPLSDLRLELIHTMEKYL